MDEPLVDDDRCEVSGCEREERIAGLCLPHRRATLDKSGWVSKTPEYICWLSMKARCYNPNQKSYVNYGGRGIAIADEWLNDFQAFRAHIGPRPSPGHSIDRIDNDGGYYPGNVRWATATEQAQNKRPRSDECAADHDISWGSPNVYVSKQGFRHCKQCQSRRASERRQARRGQPKPEEVVRRHRDETRLAARRAQEQSLEHTTRRRVPWTPEEMMLASRADLTAVEVSKMTGRSYTSVGSLRARLKRNAALGLREETT